MKKWAALSLAAVLAFGALTGCSSSSEEQTEPASTETTTEETTTEETTTEETEGEAEGTSDLGYDKLIIGLDDTFAPMGYRDENNELIGFDIDLANAVGEVLGIPVEFQPINWDTKESELNNGNVDLLWNGFTITPEREEIMAFTKPYLDNAQVVLTMDGAGIETLADLAGKTVATQVNSSGESAIKANEEFYNSLGELVTFGTYDECLRDMEAGRADAVVGDVVLLAFYVQNHPDTAYYMLEENLGDEQYGVGARKEDTALVDAISDAFQELKDNGTGAEISEKWFGEDIFFNNAE